MQTVNDLIGNRLTDLFTELGAFWAFGNKQFEESRKDGVVYIDCGYGLICPKDNTKILAEKMAALYKEGRQEQIRLYSPEAIIKHELYNYESFYTMDFSNALAALEPYGFDLELIAKVINETKAEYYEANR